ncbi:nuclear transport factor 2 family protein [Aureisphaera galaxeae]|uniref:nuclear transport factor 2 family protein n=1 Tax=Aureisphaera galaxeae TaxID=1538023 RepID=UPI0023507907|nr:nuclear transport factor 2 family protein [Aureisphaera galaxeae]MDC8004685.1 nuclear transport factor 2 family protein [Aureisphaera galaxeae]
MNCISYRTLILVLIGFLTITSCNQPLDSSLEEERNKILELHNLQRDYHFKKDSIAFANQLADDFISVNKGVVSTPQRDATISRYHGYFSSVEFEKWDDVTLPIIKFSDDLTMAYTVVDKIVEITRKDSLGNDVRGQTHFAWTAIYRKYGDEWKIECVTSTNKP